MRHRNARARRRRDRARDPGDDVVRNAGALQRERFLAAATEHERIAALQADNAAAAPRGANYQPVNRFLRHGVSSGALADEKLLRTACILQHAIVDQRVVQHEIGRAQPGDCFPRQQSRVAGTGADERDVSFHNHESSGALSHGTCANVLSACAAGSAVGA